MLSMVAFFKFRGGTIDLIIRPIQLVTDGRSPNWAPSHFKAIRLSYFYPGEFFTHSGSQHVVSLTIIPMSLFYRMEDISRENTDLRKKCDKYEQNNQSLISQLHKLQAMLKKLSPPQGAAQTGICLMVGRIHFTFVDVKAWPWCEK